MPLAKTYHQRRAFDSAALFVAGLDQTGKGREQRQRHVIDAEIAQILEGINGGAHPRAAQAGDNHDVRSIRLLAPGRHFDSLKWSSEKYKRSSIKPTLLPFSEFSLTKVNHGSIKPK